MSFRGTMFRALLFAAGLHAPAAYAQDVDLFGQGFPLYATTFEQCTMQSDRRREAINALNDQIQQCLRNHPSTRWTHIAECGYGGSAGCARLEAQRCILRDRDLAEGRLCRDRAQEHQRQEAERERLADAETRQSELAFQMAGSAAGRGNYGALGAIGGRYISPTDATRPSRRLMSDGMRVANFAGVPTSSAMALSRGFTAIGMRAYRDIGAGALAQLDAAAGSGAFRIDGQPTGFSAPTRLSPSSEAMRNEARAYAQLWQEGGQVGRIIVAAALTARIVAVLQDRPSAETSSPRPSLINGTFARHVNGLSAAAARGDIRLTDGAAPYVLMSQAAVASMAPAQQGQADAARRQAAERARAGYAATERARFDAQQRQRESARYAREGQLLREAVAAQARRDAERLAQQSRPNRAWDFGGFMSGVLSGLANTPLIMPPSPGVSVPCTTGRESSCELGVSR